MGRYNKSLHLTKPFVTHVACARSRQTALQVKPTLGAAWSVPWSRWYPLTVSPTVKRVGPYRFFFFAGDFVEPPHVHVERDRAVAKFWLKPVSIAYSRLFAAHELRQIEQMVKERSTALLEAWNEFFGT